MKLVGASHFARRSYYICENAHIMRMISFIIINLTTNLAAVVWMCVSVQILTNFCPHALISNPNVPKILFA